ncbi:hypothetical protein HK101_003432 [Irineochytrium annulatum]|nr:hypothetical protein HK101_003432 [Irineochytrium annulatum]
MSDVERRALGMAAHDAAALASAAGMKEQATDWLEVGASLGHGRCMYVLAVSLWGGAEGEGMRARALMAQAIAEGCEDARSFVGVDGMLFGSAASSSAEMDGKMRKIGEAVRGVWALEEGGEALEEEVLRDAAETGSFVGCYDLGVALVRRGELREAVGWFERAARSPTQHIARDAAHNLNLLTRALALEAETA